MKLTHYQLFTQLNVIATEWDLEKIERLALYNVFENILECVPSAKGVLTLTEPDVNVKESLTPAEPGLTLTDSEESVRSALTLTGADEPVKDRLTLRQVRQVLKKMKMTA